MKIALLAPPYLPVPPDGYGGTERIVAELSDGLVAKGHDVTLFATGDSKTKAKLVSTFPVSLGNSGEIKAKPLLPLLQYIDCFSRAKEFDLIHNHAQYYAMFLADLVSTPFVHTLHGSIFAGEVPEEKRQVLSRFKHHNFISISKNQQKAFPELNWRGVAYNGIDISEFPFVEKPENYLLWVGRITQKKGTLEAIDVAKKLNMKLKLVGVVDPIDEPFFTSEVKPLIDGDRVEHIGEVDGIKKAELYGNALATLYPISWHEPFGLVMAESMACGTPVIGFRIGSVPELVKDTVTGFVVDNLDQMTEAVKNISGISRKKCRERVEQLFSTESMVGAYDKLYKIILEKNNE